jgi:hypothetical protein
MLSVVAPVLLETIASLTIGHGVQQGSLFGNRGNQYRVYVPRTYQKQQNLQDWEMDKDRSCHRVQVELVNLIQIVISSQ